MKKTLPFLLSFIVSVTSLSGQNFSLHFDGDDDYAIFPDCEAMTSSCFTIEGWFKCGYSDEPQVIMMSFLDLPEKNANVTLEVRSNGLFRFNYRPVAVVLGGEDMYSTTPVNDNQWHHFAAIKGFDDVKGGDGRLRLFIDGLLEVEKIGYFEDIGIAPLFEMGRNRYEPQANYRLLQGHIDDFKIWELAKSSAEVFQGFESESSGSELGLFSNYKFDIALDTVYDCSINNRHGNRNGALGINNLPQYSPLVPPLVDKMCEPQSVGIEDGLLNPNAGWSAVISPNPVSEILKVELTDIQKIYGQIYASDGGLICEVTFADRLNSLDVSELPIGAYLIRLSNFKTTKAYRFIKI